MEYCMHIHSIRLLCRSPNPLTISIVIYLFNINTLEPYPPPFVNAPQNSLYST